MRVDILARRWGGPQGGRDGMAIAVSYLAWTLADLGHDVHCYAPDGAAHPWEHERVEWIHRTPLSVPDDWSAHLIITTISPAWRRTAIAAQQAGAVGRLVYWWHHGAIPSGHGAILARVSPGPPVHGWTREVVLPPSTWALSEGGEATGSQIVVPGAAKAKGGQVALAVARLMPEVPWYVLPGRASRTDLAPWRELRHVTVGLPGQPPETWLRHARAVLSPTRAETYGLCLAEAAVRGIPVVASDLPGTRYSVGEVALLLPMDARPAAWAAALSAALSSPSARLQLEPYADTARRAVGLLLAGRPTPPTEPPPRRRAQRPAPLARPAPHGPLPSGGTVSLLMAVGPVHRWLDEAVRSTLEQELPDGWQLELLIGVDGVPASLEAARRCAGDPRVGIVFLDRPAGTYVAATTMLRHAAGDLVGRVDADDVQLPGRLAALIVALDADPQASMANALISDTDADLGSPRPHPRPADGIWLWRREALDLLGGWQPWPCGADTEMLQRAHLLGLRDTVVQSHLYLRRRHGDQLTRAAGTGHDTPMRQAAWAMIRAQRDLAAQGARPTGIVPEVAPHSIEGPLFDAPVWAGLASIPRRRDALAQVVASLLPQVDQLGVYLNGYPDVPDFLGHPRIMVARSQDHGDHGDAGKLRWAGQAPGYYLSCDDDIRYPPDYARRLVAALRARGRRCVVGVHGVLLRPDADQYHRGRTVLHYREALDADQPVHVLGTGTAGWYAPSLRVSEADCPVPNMADLWLARRAQLDRIPMVALARPAEWLGDLTTGEGSIYQESHRRTGGAQDTAEHQDRLVRELAPWALHEVTGWSRATTSGPTGTTATAAAGPAAPAAPAPRRPGRSSRSSRPARGGPSGPSSTSAAATG